MDKKSETLAKKIKELLADHLGLEPDDIQDEDSFVEDLHMRPTELSDFIEGLTSSGIDTSRLDLIKIENFADLIEQIASGEYLD